MAAAQDGDAAAYMRLLREIAPFIRFLLRRRIRNADQIEDVLQDVLLTVHRVRQTYDPARPFIPWLASITYRRAIDSGRRKARIGAWEEQMPELIETMMEPAANDVLETRERRAWLRRAVSDLPPKQRQALELVKIDELSVAEAAGRSGQSQGAIKVNVHRGLVALRRMLERD